MLDLKPLIDLPPAIVNHQLLVAVGTLAYFLITAYYKGQSRKTLTSRYFNTSLINHGPEIPQLTHIPSTEPDVPLFSYVGAFKYLLHPRKVVISGVQKMILSKLSQWPNAIFKIPGMLQWLVVATEPKVVEEIRKAPENLLSFKDAVDEALQTEYTVGGQINMNPYHVPIIRAQLTKALPQLMRDVHEEVVDAFNEFIPLTSEWTGVKASDTFINVVCRASNRVFVGRPLCRDPDFVALNIQYTVDIVQALVMLRIVPHFLRPLANKLFSNVPKRTRECLKLLAPAIAARRKQREASDDKDERPMDLLTWLMDEAKDKEATDWYLTSRMLAINFAAIHSSSMTFTHALYYLATFPEYMKPLREEVEEIIQREGWTKEGIDQMHKIDSFIKEAQRLHPIAMRKITSYIECSHKANYFSVAMPRVAVNDHTFSDGTTVPRGTTVSIAIDSIHLNEKIYADPLKFDPFRFVKLQEQDDTGRRYDMVTTGVDSLTFGHGRHACPGRHFAATELKLILAHLVMNYDVKLEKEGVRPADTWIMSACIPDPNAKTVGDVANRHPIEPRSPLQKNHVANYGGGRAARCDESSGQEGAVPTLRSAVTWAVVSWHLTRWATSFIGHPTDTAHVTLAVVFVFGVTSVPAPLSNCMPSFNDNSHRVVGGHPKAWEAHLPPLVVGEDDKNEILESLDALAQVLRILDIPDASFTRSLSRLGQVEEELKNHLASLKHEYEMMKQYIHPSFALMEGN
ncbi:hypothetical protein M413DRAFT_12344 [Hebeloma cylindrosporum]|uniref:Cytochrome P450 n=1 Tax=Hebeloma cylindrosporum TaxID=76867 RepID=A0A0C2YD94_HEBCY|nr:hypothetical protein M413DRAFT_12344 [Hebeloma cylindrosporum h7]